MSLFRISKKNDEGFGREKNSRRKKEGRKTNNEKHSRNKTRE
jgi:hypothetical protein